MKYYAIINNVQVGPHTPEELMSLGMSRDTLVWREGMHEWMQAWRLPELDSCFFSVAPGDYYRQSAGVPPCPPTYLAWSLVVTLCCCLVPGVVALVYSVSVESRYGRGDYDGARRASQAALIWIWITVGLVLLIYPIMFPVGLALLISPIMFLLSLFT